MGSKPVRERHHALYGSTVRSLNRHEQFANPHATMDREEFRTQQENAMDRLSQPKRTEHKQHQFLRNKNMQNRAEMENMFANVTWLYASMHLAKEEVNIDNPMANSSKAPIADSGPYRKAIKLIDRLMKQSGIEPTEDKKLKAQLRINGKHGLLFDIITTRRVILSGEPHKVGTELYRYMTRKYHAVKFAFVGITDNGSKRVARDIFCKDKIHSDEAYDKYITKSTFHSVDNNHMYVVFPENDPYIDEIIAAGIQRVREEEETRRARYFTPKYVAPQPPPFIQKGIEKQKQREIEAHALESPGQRCSPCKLMVPTRPAARHRINAGPRSPLVPMAQRPPETVSSLAELTKLVSLPPLTTPPRVMSSASLPKRQKKQVAKPRARLAAPLPGQSPIGSPAVTSSMDTFSADFLRGSEARLQDINHQFRKRLKNAKSDEVVAKGHAAPTLSHHQDLFAAVKKTVEAAAVPPPRRPDSGGAGARARARARARAAAGAEDRV
eukprot:NODE_952_length_1801_cov_30.266553_g839_i0.p1 GENE.NODE_952_length_1801_cov_30.266553_g839_i0~~NODE_952_length_1801_cov_30.266553_g839_i0.p1  ORF type:complete len:497 (-),score=74.84 NODE_952_length_1801_cov_30.266553_g839_i0:177-1667(-)